MVGSVLVREVKTGGGTTSKTAQQFYIHEIQDKKKADSPIAGLSLSGQTGGPASQGKNNT
jgi:hypothetical protein